MKKVLLALAGAAIAASAMANPEAIYRCVPLDTNLPDGTIDPLTVHDPNRNDGYGTNFYAPGVITNGETNERGGRITFGGTARNVTEASIAYIYNVAAGVTTQTVRLRFYATAGGTPIPNMPDTVGQVLFDSGNVAAKAIDGSQRFTIPNVVMPNVVYYTFKPEGVDQVTNLIGARMFGAIIGTPNDRLVRKDSSISAWASSGVLTARSDMTQAAGLQAPRSFALCVWADGGPSIPYEATTAASNFADASTYATDTLPIGDDVEMEGQNRHITEMQFNYVSDVAVPDGDEFIQIDLWSNDYTVPYGEPSATAFYTVASIPVADGTAGPTGYALTLTDTTGVDVPDDFAWTMTVTGVFDAAGDAAGPFLAHAPTSGNSSPYFYIKDGSGVNGWGTYWFGNPTQTSNTTTTGGTTYGNPTPNFAAAFRSTLKLEASSTNIVRGSTLAGIWSNISSYSADVRWGVRPGAVLIASQDKVVVQANFFLPAATVTTMDVVVESKGNVANLRQKVDIKNGAAATFTNLETFTGLPNVGADRTVTLPVASPSTMIDTANANKVVVQLSCNNTTGVLVFPWQYQIDACYLNITP